MEPCRHLDYDGPYSNCEVVEYEGCECRVRYWKRGGQLEGNAINVQFCRQRGRVNHIFTCYTGEEGCYDTPKATP